MSIVSVSEKPASPSRARKPWPATKDKEAKTTAKAEKGAIIILVK
jgi:hypothetical protein